MTRRATLRGAERTPLAGAAARADVLICGASFAGLAVARELAGSGADVLIVDRYEIGERATSACAAPTPWLHAMGAEGAIRQELECMAFHTPHGSARYRLPWSWSSFDYRELCIALWEQCGDARFAVAKVDGRTRNLAGEITVHTDRGDLTAPLTVDALGWRRVLGAGPNVQPPDAPISRRGYAWAVPAGGERRIGVGSYEPRDHVKDPTVAMADRLGSDAERFQGNWFPHALRPAVEDGVLFVGDSAGHCLPLSGEGIRTAFYFGIAAGRELRAVLAGEQDRDAAAARYAAFSARHARAYRIALRLQRLIPALAPRALTALLALLGRPRLCRPAFRWYLGIAPPPATPSRRTRRPRSPASPAPARAPRRPPAAPAAASSTR
jgi:flavin-dependent dehydrogenase